MILEGQDLYSSGLHPNAIRGLWPVWLLISTYLLFPPAVEDTAAMIHRLAIREFDKGSRDVQVRADKNH